MMDEVEAALELMRGEPQTPDSVETAIRAAMDLAAVEVHVDARATE